MSWKRIKRRVTALILCAGVTAAGTGCAQNASAVTGRPEDVTLIEPVKVGETYEIATRRNLYDYRILNGLVCPYTEEFQLEMSQRYDSYNIMPGESVKKGQTIIRTMTEDMDQQIEAMEKKIAEDDANYQEYLQDNAKPLAELRREEEIWGDAVENWSKEKPKEYVTVTGEDGNPVQQVNPAYEKWSGDMKYYEARYGNALIALQKMEAAMEQREELYQLDSAHNRVLLNRMKKHRADNSLISGMDGVLTNVPDLVRGDQMYAKSPMAAVADPSRRILKTDFVNSSDMKSAERVFAVIDGTQCEVVYEPMDSAQYKRLSDANGKENVYSTFRLPEEFQDVELGTYVAVVLVKKSRTDAITVSKKAVYKNEGETYVFVLRDGESVQTPVKTGMQDGLYMEIVSGVEEGDQIVVDAPDQPQGTQTQKLAKGSVSNLFSKDGKLAYLQTDSITNTIKHGTVYLEELLVERNQQVTKGDPIAKIRVVGDPVELARLERSLLREQERTAALRKEDAENNTDKNAKAIKYREQTIADLEKQIAEIKSEQAMTEIKAPYDGVIRDVNWDLALGNIQPGDILRQGFWFGNISSRDSNYIIVNNAGNLLTYGNKATVEYTSKDGTMKTAEGEVVTLNLHSVSRSLFNTQDGVQALIRLPAEVKSDVAGDYLMGEGYWMRECTYTVNVDTRKMDNVVVVPKRAVAMLNGSTYAKVKREDGSVIYQGFIAGGSNDDYYWVAEGLTEGMEVCIE